MELLSCKARLAALWVIKGMGFSAFLLLGLMKQGTIEELMAGKVGGMELSEGMMVMYGLFWWIPWVMAWLSMTLKGAANRWTNFVLGLIFAIYLIIHMIQQANNCTAAMLVDVIVGIVVSLLIAWYAWKMPKEEV